MSIDELLGFGEWVYAWPEGSMTYKKKLIEVARPLDSINQAYQHEKSVPR